MDTEQEIVDYLNKDGNHYVPCGRYGRNTFECSPIAAELALVFDDGEGVSEVEADWAMGLVVNSHDDVAAILGLGDDDDDI